MLGSISQWGEVSKPKKERAKPKGKSDTFTTTTAEFAPSGPRPARGGRAVPEGGRGGRGRATERGGRGGARGKSSAPAVNGTRHKDSSELSVPTEEWNAWDNNKTAEASEHAAPEAAEPAAPAAPVTASAAKPAPSPENAPKTWASMLRQSTAPKPAPKPKEAPVPKPAEAPIEPLPPAEPEPVEPEPPVVEKEPTPEPEEEPAPAPAAEVPTVVVPEVALPPSKDQLTETNLEQITDTSQPAPTGTARSEATDSWDPRAQAPSATATPLSASQQQHQTQRAPSSGYIATATKATERTATRTPSHPRRILEQREAVRMPGNRDQVDRAAVQFGAFSLNGPIDDDIDGDREEPETRPQPPEDSPVAHPRTSLPPAQPAPVPEAFPVQKPATLPPTGPAGMGFPLYYVPSQTYVTDSAPAAAPTASSQVPPTAPSQGTSYSPPLYPQLYEQSLMNYAPAAVQPPTAPSAQQQFGRFGQPVPQEPASFQATKQFESFGQQQQATATAAQNQFEGGFPGQAQPAQPQAAGQPGGAFSSAPSDFSSYYTADQGRNAYNSYYVGQGFSQQQGAQGQQESSQSQRPFGGYNAQQADNLSQYPQSGAQGRFGSGSATDNQASAATTQGPSATQGQAVPTAQGQTHGQQQPHDYPYNNHPYYTNPYYSNYMSYQNSAYGQGGYGAPYGKGALGYQPNQYGMSPQGPHAYGTSPAGAFGQSTLHRESGVGGGLGDYARGASAQSGQQQGLGGSGFGGMHDTFGRGSAYQSQGGQGFNAPGPQAGSVPSAADDLKPFGDSKATGGPSPSLGAAARPGSAANNAPSQTGLPPPQSAQQGGLSGIGGYGYPSHLQGHGLHGSQSGAGGYGMSASGGQGHQSTYGAGGYGNQSYGGNFYQNPPRGWGASYH